MKVWQVSTNNHEHIATCDSYESAVWFLIRYNWIDRYSEYWDTDAHEWINIFQLVNIPIDKNNKITNEDKEKLYNYIIKHFWDDGDIWKDWIYFEKDKIETAVPV